VLSRSGAGSRANPSLLAARLWHSDPARFDRLFEIQARTAREREWGYKFPDKTLRQAALGAVEAHFVKGGATARDHMDNGYELEATIIRRGLPSPWFRARSPSAPIPMSTSWPTPASSVLAPIRPSSAISCAAARTEPPGIHRCRHAPG